MEVEDIYKINIQGNKGKKKEVIEKQTNKWERNKN